MERRQFLKSTLATSSLIGLGQIGLNSFIEPSEAEKKITILHTNDVHSHIDPFPANHAKNPNSGGVSRRASLVNEIRAKEKNVLLVDAGDIFQGTPYFNYYEGELEIKLMSLMKYDLATLGNHDFDNGLEGFEKQLKHAKFDFVNSNYDFKNTILDQRIKPYKIFNIDDVKIGFFGIGIELNGLVGKKMYKETKYLDPIEVTTSIVHELKKEHRCDLIICLSHLGYEYKNSKISDIKLAKATKDIDLIIGGHTHTFLEKPVIHENTLGKKVLINQVGCYGLNLGRIDFYLSKDKKYIGQEPNISV